MTNVQDDLGRLTETVLKNLSHAVLNGHTYVYNEGHERKNQVRLTRVDSSGTARLVTNAVSYTYDAIGQLKTALGWETNETLRLNEQFEYGYDKAGNLSNRLNNGFMQVFSVNALNQLTAVARGTNSFTLAGAVSLTPAIVTVNG